MPLPDKPETPAGAVPDPAAPPAQEGRRAPPRTAKGTIIMANPAGPPKASQSGTQRPRLFSLRKDSLIYQTLFKPRWKPWSPQRVIVVTIAFAAVMGILVLVSPTLSHGLRARIYAAMNDRPRPPEETAPEVTPAESAAPGDRADAALNKKGRSPVAPGLLTLPEAFASADGKFDLVIHFHGNTDLVEESFQKIGINAAVVIMNLGTGSGVYEDRYSNPITLPDVLERTRSTLEKRGLRGASMRRLALTAWSAGYGAVARILERPELAAKIDAVVLLDGIHCGYRTGSHELALDRLAPFERFGKEAVEGKKLFSITHSNITPVGNYAGTHETTDALLRLLGVERKTVVIDPLPVPALGSIDGVIPKKSLRPLRPQSEAHLRGLYVRGYAGDQPEDHSMHLVEMSVTALPDLVQYWSESTPR